MRNAILRNHLKQSRNKSCKQSISREETVVIWFTFKPGSELTGFQATRLCFQQVNLTWAREPIESSTWSAVNFNKTRARDMVTDTGQRIAWFDRCQLIITWCHISKKYTVNQGSMSLSTYYLEYGRHIARLHRRRRRRAYAPTRNTAGHDNTRKSILGFPLFPYMGMGLRLAALRAAGAPL